MNKVSRKAAQIVAKLALSVTKMNANSTCDYILHQPKLPKGAEKLRKF